MQAKIRLLEKRRLSVQNLLGNASIAAEERSFLLQQYRLHQLRTGALAACLCGGAFWAICERRPASGRLWLKQAAWMLAISLGFQTLRLCSISYLWTRTVHIVRKHALREAGVLDQVARRHGAVPPSDKPDE